MAKQIVNEMATNLTLDSNSASQALKELTREVKNSSAEAKILENQYKASGDAVSSSKAKYEGLQSTLEAQKTKIEALKSGLDNVNTSTKKGQDLQQYLTNELAKAERQYASYNGQLEKAKQAYTYQESGLAKLNSELKHGNDLTEARVQKLQAEGREDEANKVKLENLKNVQRNYTEQLSIQKTELNKLAESGAKNSDAYKRQQLRVEKMGAKLASTTSDIKHFNNTEIKPETRGISSAKSKLNELDDKLTSTSSHFKSVFLGNLAANAVTNAFETMKEKLSETVQGAIEYNKQMQVMDATWTTLTGDADKSKEMVSGIKSISTAFGQTTDLTNELEQQFYHVFNQKEPTEQLTKSVLTMADTIGLSSEATERLGLNFTHMMTSSKMQLGDFNVITDQLPMFGEKLLEFEQAAQHNTKLTMSELRAQMTAGKISAEDAEKVMNELGDKYKTASENMLQTASGMERVISARGEALAGALINPIMNAKNPLFGAISKWVSDDRTEKEFNKVGESISHAFSTITEAFGKEFKAKDFTEAANKSLEGMASNIERFGDYIAKHKDSIIGFFSATKDLSGTGFSVMGDTLKIAMPLLEDLGQFAQKHPEQFKIMAESIIAINLAFKGMHGAVKLANTVLDTFSGLASGIKWGAKVLGIEAETKAIQEQNAVLMENNALSAGGGVGGTAKTVATEAGTIGSRAAGAGGAISTAGKVSKFGKVASIGGQVASKVVAPIAGLFTAIDVGDSIYKAVTSNKSQEKLKAAGKVSGTAIGGTIGAVLGSVIPGAGTVAGGVLGASIGDALGSTKTAEKIVSKFHNTFKDAFKKQPEIKIKAPKLDTKSAYEELDKASKKYYDKKAERDLADIKLLRKNGLMSKEEYENRLKDIQQEADKGKRVEKLSQEDRTTLSKYYASQRQKLEESFNKKKRDDTKSWDTKIANDAALYGAKSYQVKQDQKKKEQALEKDDQNKKKAINDLTVKNATKTSLEEAKAHGTATQKIEVSSNKQKEILSKLVDAKGKLTNKELQDLLNKSQKEYNTVKENADKKYKAAKDAADKQYNSVTKAAEKQYDKVKDSADKEYKHVKKAADDQYENVKKAAENQYKAAEKSANKQYDATVKAAENQYKGNSKWAQEQRKKVTDEANHQKAQSIDHAVDQYNGTVKQASKQHNDVLSKAKDQHKDVVDKANKQKEDVINKSVDQYNGALKSATKQRDDVVDKARKQRDDSKDAAKEQSHGVVSHAVAQANSSMEAASKQGKGTNNIWSSIGEFFNGLVKGFGVKGVDVTKGNYSYTPMGMPAYATGTDGASGGQALVGEAGIEARYSPYSGKIDLLGHNGAQVVNLNPGDKILNARDTAKLFQGGLGKTLPGYAKGTSSLESFISSVTKGASNIWDDVSDAASNALSKITDPIKSLTDIATKAFDVNSIPEVGDVGHASSKGMVDESIKGIGNFLKKLISSNNSNTGDGGGGKGAPSGAGVSRWRSQVVDALKANGLSTSSGMVDKVLRQIQTESGGNEKAVQGNIGDVNNASGDLAKGLMQVISATFNAYKFPGHSNPFNGYDSLLAGLNYAKHTYGNDLSFLGNGHGYANGGLITKHQIAEIGENNQPEMIIPLDGMKSSRGFELLGKTAVAMASRDGLTGSSATSDSSALEAKIEQGNQLLSSMVQLLSGILGQTTEANQSVDDIAMNKFSKSVIARAVRSAN